jgi:hypothetical protein
LSLINLRAREVLGPALQSASLTDIAALQRVAADALKTPPQSDVKWESEVRAFILGMQEA